MEQGPSPGSGPVVLSWGHRALHPKKPAPQNRTAPTPSHSSLQPCCSAARSSGKTHVVLKRNKNFLFPGLCPLSVVSAAVFLQVFLLPCPACPGPLVLCASSGQRPHKNHFSPPGLWGKLLPDPIGVGRSPICLFSSFPSPDLARRRKALARCGCYSLTVGCVSVLRQLPCCTEREKGWVCGYRPSRHCPELGCWGCAQDQGTWAGLSTARGWEELLPS